MHTAHSDTAAKGQRSGKKGAKAFDAEAWAKEREEKLAAAHEALATGLKALQTSDDWRKMLAGLAQLGPLSIARYSFTNAFLLQVQRPGITHAGTFKAWLAVGRHVRKGERALGILAPVIIKARAKQEASEAGEQEDAGGERKKRMRFRTLAVFALEQTDGPELPQLSPPDITSEEAFAGSVEKLAALALQLPGSPVSGVELRARRAGDHADADGWYNIQTRAIVVITGEKSRAYQFGVLLHELGHAFLHGTGDKTPGPRREVEAESVAFVVCHALGLDTSAMAFPYVANWAQGDDAQAVVVKSCERILGTARTLLTAIMPEAFRAAAGDAGDTGDAE